MANSSLELICIYCRASAPDLKFTREHVMHRGFGGFRGSETLVLHDMVCGKCNQEFGDTIDLALTRDSAEGLERYLWGIRDPSELGSFRGRDIVERIDDGDFRGSELRRRYDEEHDRIVHDLVPTVAVRNVDDDGFTFFSAEEAKSGAILENQEVDWRRGIRIMGSGPSVDTLRAALEDQGIHPDRWTDLQPPPDNRPFEVKLELQISDACRRALAKITFNYLAARTTPEFVLTPQFDSIRQFIRYGSEPPTPLVIADPDHSFNLKYNDGRSITSPSGEIPVVHVVSLETHSSHNNILGCVTLFSLMTYKVLLAVAFDGVWPSLPTGHVFNVAERDVTEIGPQPYGKRI